MPDHQTIHVLRCVRGRPWIPSMEESAQRDSLRFVYLTPSSFDPRSPSKTRRQGFVARGWARTGMHNQRGRAAIKEKRKVSRASASSKFLQVEEKTWSSFSSQYQESVRYAVLLVFRSFVLSLLFSRSFLSISRNFTQFFARSWRTFLTHEDKFSLYSILKEPLF